MKIIMQHIHTVLYACIHSSCKLPREITVIKVRSFSSKFIAQVLPNTDIETRMHYSGQYIVEQLPRKLNQSRWWQG